MKGMICLKLIIKFIVALMIIALIIKILGLAMLIAPIIGLIYLFSNHERFKSYSNLKKGAITTALLVIAFIGAGITFGIGSTHNSQVATSIDSKQSTDTSAKQQQEQQKLKEEQEKKDAEEKAKKQAEENTKATETQSTSNASSSSTSSTENNSNTSSGHGSIKGNINSKGEKIYHVPGGAFYDKTDAEEWFNTEAEAQAAGYRKSKR